MTGTVTGAAARIVTGLVAMADLGGLFNNVGTTTRGRLGDGAFNIWSNTFPAEEFPPPGVVFRVGRIPFRLGPVGNGAPDNLRCAGQVITVPPGRYDWVYLLAAAERRTEDEAALHYRDGSVDPEWLRASDFWPQTSSRFGHRPAITCSVLHYPRHGQPGMRPTLWRSRMPVTREEDLIAIRMPDNPAVHVFAITLRGSEEDAL